jgi:SAM-dependent methyltransferase
MDTKWRPAGVTAQFMEDASTYHERYFDRLDFEQLVGRMLRLAEVPVDAPLNVLDIGSGGGSSVFAALKLLPRGNIVATDISPALLTLLAEFVARRDDFKARVSSFCFDLHEPFFERNTFDLVVGCAILHHLTNPFEALRHVAYSLKKGGKIVMCEPLEAGHLINLFVYDEVIQVARQDGGAIDQRLILLMQAMRRDIQARQGPPDEKPWTRQLDDKWVFDAAYLSDLTAQLKCERVSVFPAQEDLSRVFEASFVSLLADSGNSDLVLSDRVLEYLRLVDHGISNELKQKLCPTGIVVITK